MNNIFFYDLKGKMVYFLEFRNRLTKTENTQIVYMLLRLNEAAV